MVTALAVARAYKEVRESPGAQTPGIDGVTCAQVERKGVGSFLRDLVCAVANEKYTPLPLRRTLIPKGDGTMRELAIPSVRDRVIARVLAFTVGERFADEVGRCFAFVHGVGVYDAINVPYAFISACNGASYVVVKVDIQNFFPSIDRARLLSQVNERVLDRETRRLVRMHVRFRVEGDQPTTGLAQGSPLSPVLSNIFLAPVDRVFDGLANAGSSYVRYADDLMIVVRGTRASATERLAQLRSALMERGLKLKDAKTVFAYPGDHVDFLGHRMHLPSGDTPLALSVPPIAIVRLHARLEEICATLPREAGVIDALDIMRRTIQGWLSFFRHCVNAEAEAQAALTLALHYFLLHPHRTADHRAS